jgi:GT2 family glycosyltransferase
MSILISTLNHNLPGLTDNLISQLKQSIRTDIEFMVLDNGSEEQHAKTTTHTIDNNVFFGGGVNIIMDKFLSTNHDYLMILNNDLLFHGYRYVSELVYAAEKSNLAVISPSIINTEIEQCYWKQMHCWGTKFTRNVKWVDFQAPMLRRDICEIIIQYPMELYLGWGIDFYTGLVAEDNGLKIGVHDGITIAHLNSQTFKQNKINIDTNVFCQTAEKNMYDYFMNSKYKERYLEYRNYAETYNY